MNTDNTFGDFEDEFKTYSNSAIALLPVPYDLTSTYHKGADRGPQAIISASTALENFDIETETEVYRRGICTLEALEVTEGPEVLFEQVKTSVKALFEDKKFPVVLGGEHSVTVGAVAAAKESYPNLSVLQLDAHADTRETYHGSPYNHACVMARVREMCPMVQVGIRSLDGAEWSKLDRERVYFAHDVASASTGAWLTEAVEQLSQDVWVTIDLDCFDPSIIPSTGTPEPGGLTWYQVTNLLKKTAESKRIVGFDVVELLPRASNPAPDFVAAKLIYQFLSYIWALNPN
ncbi:MAG: agmatinase [Bdellovibrionales bacterium]|nr:agmatinase [Bdellovibrionales bacterium]